MPRFVYAALILLSLIWGGSFYFIKMLLLDFGPWTIAFLRSACGLIVVAIIMLALKKPFAFRTIPWLAMGMMSIINTAIPWALIGFSETRLTSSMASILNATTPIWTIVVGMLFFGQKSGRAQWLGICIASFGLIILVGIESGSFLSVDTLGVICMLAASICYGIGSQLSKRLLNGFSMYQITFGTLLGCMLATGSMAFTVEEAALSHLASLHTVLMLVGLGGLGSGIAYILFYYIVQKGSPEFATMVTYLVPCTALVWGSTLLDEEIRWNMLTGLFIILAGVFLAGRRRSGKRTTKADS
ncbi:DMT family transporter [Paenibacillus abyssi]|uniref:Multidrug DMT transporter permease n=1 Tax=Paenibacillus abyssi TaxID=1340531 RepID=A0A917CPU0_9BACL|nr:DMT family transporter [Paenibacillus abyssi]GGF93711.1 multidrug DMT transporter permease [Paenibacillus abyssi]